MAESSAAATEDSPVYMESAVVWSAPAVGRTAASAVDMEVETAGAPEGDTEAGPTVESSAAATVDGLVLESAAAMEVDTDGPRESGRREAGEDKIK